MGVLGERNFRFPAATAVIACAAAAAPAQHQHELSHADRRKAHGALRESARFAASDCALISLRSALSCRLRCIVADLLPIAGIPAAKSCDHDR